MSKRTAAAEAAAEDGFPVTVAMPTAFRGSPLTVTFRGERHHYDVPDDGVVSAATRARLDVLLRVGGRPTISPPDGSGDQSPPTGDDTAE